jgi:hypothetical protein
MAAGTRDLTTGTAQARPANYSLNPFLIKQVVDFNAVAKLKGAAIEANEVIQSITVPAGMFVQKVLVKILTAATATGLTMSVGDGDDTDGFDTSVDLAATAGTITYNGNASTAAATHGDGAANVLTDAYSAGKAYTAADTIDLKVLTYNTVSVLPVVQVTAVCIAL